MKAAWLICVFAGASCFAGRAQGESEIVTDRPDITESSIVIPPGSLQGENGLAWTSDHGKRTFDLSETLLRLGLWRRTEVRFGVPDYFDSILGRLNSSGFADFSVGFKEQLGPLPGRVDLSVIVAVSLPTGSSGVSSHGFDPFLKFPWSRELKGSWSVGGMQSLFYYTQAGRRNLTWEPTFYLEREVTKHLDAFIEYGGDYPRFGGARQVIHAGTAYRITPKQQIDFHFGFGLSPAAPNNFFAAGYSFRIDRIFGAFHRSAPASTAENQFAAAASR